MQLVQSRVLTGVEWSLFGVVASSTPASSVFLEHMMLWQRVFYFHKSMLLKACSVPLRSLDCAPGAEETAAYFHGAAQTELLELRGVERTGTGLKLELEVQEDVSQRRSTCIHSIATWEFHKQMPAAYTAKKLRERMHWRKVRKQRSWAPAH